MYHSSPPSFSYGMETVIVIENKSKVKRNLEYVSLNLTPIQKWQLVDKLVMVYNIVLLLKFKLRIGHNCPLMGF